MNKVNKYGKKMSFGALFACALAVSMILFFTIRVCRNTSYRKRKASEMRRQEKEFLLQNQGNGRYVNDRLLYEDESDENQM